MRNDKVECQCCRKMMVPKVITGAPFYVSGIPVGGGEPEGSICPFCLSPKWMVTEAQAISAVQANAEFYVLLVLTLVSIVVFVRVGPWSGGVVFVMLIAAFLLRAKLIRLLKMLRS